MKACQWYVGKVMYLQLRWAFSIFLSLSATSAGMLAGAPGCPVDKLISGMFLHPLRLLPKDGTPASPCSQARYSQWYLELIRTAPWAHCSTQNLVIGDRELHRFTDFTGNLWQRNDTLLQDPASLKGTNLHYDWKIIRSTRGRQLSLGFWPRSACTWGKGAMNLQWESCSRISPTKSWASACCGEPLQ